MLSHIYSHQWRICLNIVAALMVENFVAQCKRVIFAIFHCARSLHLFQDYADSFKRVIIHLSTLAFLADSLQVYNDSILEANCGVLLHLLQLLVFYYSAILEPWFQLKLDQEPTIHFGV